MDQSVSAPTPANKLAPVVPNQVTVGGRIAARAIWGLTHGVAATLRWSLHDPAGVLRPGNPQRFIFVLWHNRSGLAAQIFRRYIRPVSGGRRLAAMASASKDGAIAARVLELAGMTPVRGSSSRRGPQALAELIDVARAGFDLAITPDGPRGPRYQVQAGVIALAQFTGLPLVPVSCYLSSKKVLQSWDGFQVALPFGRCEVEIGEPLPVSRRLDSAGREQLRVELERRLRAITRD